MEAGGGGRGWSLQEALDLPLLVWGGGSYGAVILLLRVVERGGSDSLPSSSRLANGAQNWDPLLPSRQGRRYLLTDPTLTELSLPVPRLALPPVKWAPPHQQLTRLLAWCWTREALRASLTTALILTASPLKRYLHFCHHANVKGGPENLRSFPEVTQLAWQGGRTLTQVFANQAMCPGQAPPPPPPK